MENKIKAGQAAKILGVSKKTLKVWADKKRLVPAAVSEGGHKLYTLEQIEEFQKEIRKKPNSQPIKELPEQPQAEKISYINNNSPQNTNINNCIPRYLVDILKDRGVDMKKVNNNMEIAMVQLCRVDMEKEMKIVEMAKKIDKLKTIIETYIHSKDFTQ